METGLAHSCLISAPVRVVDTAPDNPLDAPDDPSRDLAFVEPDLDRDSFEALAFLGFDPELSESSRLREKLDFEFDNKSISTFALHERPNVLSLSNEEE